MLALPSSFCFSGGPFSQFPGGNREQLPHPVGRALICLSQCVHLGSAAVPPGPLPEEDKQHLLGQAGQLEAEGLRWALGGGKSRVGGLAGKGRMSIAGKGLGGCI